MTTRHKPGPVQWIVLEPAVLGWVVRRRNVSIPPAGFKARIVDEDLDRERVWAGDSRGPARRISKGERDQAQVFRSVMPGNMYRIVLFHEGSIDGPISKWIVSSFGGRVAPRAMASLVTAACISLMCAIASGC
jgi:hypothetical protein